MSDKAMGVPVSGNSMEVPQQAPAAAEHKEQAGAGFESTEPRVGLIAGVGGAIMILLVLIILGVQAYFDHVQSEQIFVKVLEPVSEDLKALHARENADLNSYHYIDRSKGTVRLPINRAMDLLIQEANAKKK